MKKLLALTLAAALTLSLTACGGGSGGNSTSSSRGDVSQEKEIQLSELALAAIFATKQVKEELDDTLKNPQSLVINSIKGGVTEDLNYIFQIDYSAENSFGGSVRDQKYIRLVGNSKEGYGIVDNFGILMLYDDLASLGEIVFGEEGKEEPIETLLINPEDVAGMGIFDFNVDTILENI